jgi:hypothetical protein
VVLLVELRKSTQSFYFLFFELITLILFYSQTKVVVIENIACFWIIDLDWQHQESENIDKIVLLRVASPPPFFLQRNKK